MKKSILLIAICLITIAHGAMCNAKDYAYPYFGKVFRSFVADSYRENGKGSPDDFYRWFAVAYSKSAMGYQGVKRTDLKDFVNAESLKIKAMPSGAAKAEEELRLCAYLHRIIKKTITRFSLDRGFEFSNTERLGERQCLLQSVLISSLLQQMNVDAGVVMVYRNIAGDYSFNGHVTVLARLSTGRDIIVDASDPTPFVKHKGIFTRAEKYTYLAPVYAQGSSKIVGYRNTQGKLFNNRQVLPLDVQYIRSQFYYYRGERTPGGVISAKKTAQGLARSAYYFGKSVRLSPANALAEYMLGRTYELQRQMAKARACYSKALDLQRSYGWVPAGIHQALARI